MSADGHGGGLRGLSLSSSSGVERHVDDEARSSHLGDQKDKLRDGDARAHIFRGPAMSRPAELGFLLVVFTAGFTPHSGFHQVLSILHIIGDDLKIGSGSSSDGGGSSSSQLVWLMASYGLTAGTCILPAGRLGDVYGYKRVFVVANVWFAVFSILAGLSVFCPERDRYAVFLFARIMQGLGPALLLPNAIALLGSIYLPGARKAMVFAVFGAMAPASAIISPASTALCQLLWWPAAFCILGAVLLLIAVAGCLLIPQRHSVLIAAVGTGDQDAASSWTVSVLARELDLAGAITGVAGLVVVCIACTQASSATESWRRAYIPILLLLGLLLGLAFVYIERYQAVKPLLPAEAMNAGVGLVLFAVFCGWACFGIWIYYAWAFYESIRGASPLLATALHSPVLVCGTAASITTGLIIRRVGPAVVMAMALLAFTVGASLLATAGIDQSYWANVFLCNLIITWGMDLSFPAATLMLSDLLNTDHQGIAAGLVTTAVHYSGALSLGISAAVELRTRNGGDTKDDLLRGYRGALYLAVAFGILGFLASLLFVWTSARARPGRASSVVGGRRWCGGVP